MIRTSKITQYKNGIYRYYGTKLPKEVVTKFKIKPGDVIIWKIDKSRLSIKIER